mgnify:CR=1 FL=1
MLYPKRLSKKSFENIMEKISLIARYPKILELDEDAMEEDIRQVREIEKFLYDCNIRQYELPDIPRGKIILSNEVYNRLLNYANKSNEKDNSMTEFGGYMYGVETAPNTIYFKENNVVQMKSFSGEIQTPLKLSKEMENVIKYSDVDCIAHIHTHPFERKHYFPFPSNQDLYTYAFLQEQFNKTDKDVYFLGCLITPLNNSSESVRLNDICFMFYDKNERSFYKCSNIYFEDSRKIRCPLPVRDVLYTDSDNKVLVKEKRTILQNYRNI